MPKSRLLFVCTANLCRSPMAAAIAEELALRRGIEIETRSAGVHARAGLPVSRRVAAVCREVGLDLSSHRSQRLTPELLGWATRVAVMEEAHALAIREMLGPPEREDLVVQLGPLAGQPQIDDPTGSFWTSAYRTARDRLFVAIDRLLAGEVSRG